MVFFEGQHYIITIVTDDQGKWAMGAHGNADIHTPNTDWIGRVRLGVGETRS